MYPGVKLSWCKGDGDTLVYPGVKLSWCKGDGDTLVLGHLSCAEGSVSGAPRRHAEARLPLPGGGELASV